jgi:hypothetical protein
MLAAESDCASRCGWEGIEGATFKKGVPAILKPHLNALSRTAPAELVEYLSTSVPSEDYQSYMWTFLSADNINDVNSDIEAIQHGYFIFAVADSNFAALSLKDGCVYSAYNFEDHIEHEANTIKQFIDLSAQEFMDHEKWRQRRVATWRTEVAVAIGFEFNVTGSNSVIANITQSKEQMALTDPRWDELTDSDWDAFAIAWNAELGDEPPTQLPELPWLLDDRPTTASEYVVPMNFTASASAQWKFILAAYRRGNEKTFGHLAVGPVEQLLATHGDEYIDLFEQMADDDPSFAGMLKGCYQNRMSDVIWQRLRTAHGDVE